MNAPVGRREFFALEAGEYLERIGLLAASATTPDGEDLVRYARALRGAALMAGPAGYAVAASAIENVAKAVRDGTMAWTPMLSERLAQAVEDCKALLRRLKEWSDVDVQHCDGLAERLDSLVGSAGKRVALGGIGTGPGLSAGVRAYVAREAAAVAATLEQVAEAVEQRPAPESADALLHRLQPLRGLGALPGLSPLPELLETLDLTIAVASRGGGWPPASGRAFRATAAALARMARDIAELGIPQHDSHEIVQAADLLREAFAREDDVVPIATLFREGDPDAVVRRGAAPADSTPVSAVAVELVSLADRFRQAVGHAREGASRSARTLALASLGLAVRGLALSPPARAVAGGFLSRLDRESMSGRALLAGEGFTTILERAVVALAEAAAAGSVSGLGVALAPLSQELDDLGGITAAPPDELEIIPIESLEPDPDADVVPIESLFYDSVPAALQRPAYSPFEQTFSTWFALERGAGASTAPIVPIESLAPEPAPEPAPVAIESLLYRGRRALERADLVRRQLDAALKARYDLTGIETLLDELLALVPLALDDDR